MKIVAITTENAQWAGMAPAAAGGWVMTCPVAGMAVENGNVTGIYEKLAAVPDSWSGGRPVDAANVVTVLEQAADRTERRLWKPESKAQDAATLRQWISRVQAAA